MARTGQSFWQFLVSFFDIRHEKEDEEETIKALKADVEFRGTKMLILICAILIASIGLNMNSTAVVIGAMLISPLMGPIIGIGLGLGITDFNLIGRSVKNLGMAVGISVITSTIYFIISPISVAQSEILARTQPTTYDVLIALFGGLAGIIAGTSRSKGQVIPGVAIATALMPPLCSAGYGLATLQFNYFFGATYLFIINTVFIGLSTFIVVRALKYRRVTYVNKKRGKRLNNLVFIIVLSTIIPSVILAYRFVQKTYQEVQQDKFIKEVMVFDNSFVLSYDSEKTDSITYFNVSVIGEEIPSNVIERLQAVLPAYGLKNTVLVVKQGSERQNMEEIRHAILKDVQSATDKSYTQYLQLRNDSLNLALKGQQTFYFQAEAVTIEIRQLFNEIEKTQIGQMYSFRADTTLVDTIPYIRLTTNKKLSKERESLIRSWLSLRFKDPEIMIVKESKK
ncbi:TIGR00341 family protein [Porphyromonadaceae bacterium W3.11]|nr:TIGR00341 family protein [Porphyromonadaceae bacterium W3.11]